MVLMMFLIIATKERVPQDPLYHDFADKRYMVESIPNSWDVLSNIFFLLAGLHGLHVTWEVSRDRIETHNERVTYTIFFISAACVSLGSSYYHWFPSTQTLFWDRLPMSIAFMCLLSIITAEHINKKIGEFILIPLICSGIFAVSYWAYTENVLFQGDLRIYGVGQFGALAIASFIIFLFYSRYSHSEYFIATLLFYVFAKFSELLDKQIFQLTSELISGHTIKHILSAIGIEVIVIMIKRRVSIKKIIYY